MTDSERIATIEAIIPTLATKADLATLEVTMVRWIVGVVLAGSTIIIAVIIGFGSVVVNTVKPNQQPIVIQLPPAVATLPQKP